jgi:predicted Zn-ribbon and HTH transcriptional regulator/predicted RNA-binding Zn-ribbon protein involved in translation (DUF1610 family)
MGTEYWAICNHCGKQFKVRIGGGFLFHLLHCARCGKVRIVRVDKVRDAHLRYLKEVPYHYSRRFFSDDDLKNISSDSLSEKEYHLVVEKVAGRCRCGGQFIIDAPPRCPKCKSTDFREDPEFHTTCPLDF